MHSADMNTQEPALLRAYGWTDRVAAAFAAEGLDGIPARVTRVDRGLVSVIAPQGATRARPGKGSGSSHALATGDWVTLEVVPNSQPIVTALMKRRTAITRADAANAGPQVLAANIDVVLILHGLDRDLRKGRLERMLVAAWETGATPTIVLTKRDLVTDLDDTLTRTRSMAAGTEIIAISNQTGEGLEQVEDLLSAGVTGVVLGESGVGKSSLVNLLAGTDITVGDTRADGAGRHTTTIRELIPIRTGGVLIDTPGIRALGLWQGSEGVSRLFSDVEAVASNCRFRDCGHSNEPGCAVRDAITEGTMTDDRLADYRHLQRELESQALRSDERARRAQSRREGRRYRLGRSGKETW